MSRDVTVDGPGVLADAWRVVLRHRRLPFGWALVRLIDPTNGETISRFPFRGSREDAQLWVAAAMEEAAAIVAINARPEENDRN